MSASLDANTEQLVIDMAADYSDHIVEGKSVAIQDYLDKLPDEAARNAFKKLANMSRLIATITTIESDDAIAEAAKIIIESETAAACGEEAAEANAPSILIPITH